MPSITLTGADQRTKIEDLDRLVDMGAEIAFLYTHSPDGRKRYPDLAWILKVCQGLDGHGAIHVCGKRAREALYHGDMHMPEFVQRFQVNGIVTCEELERICKYYSNQTVITQDTGNAALLQVDAPNHAILVDASGGQGKLPSQWVRPSTSKPVGFAGGLGPENLREQLPLIAQVAVEPWWIDMEGKLRDKDDWFDVEKALQVMEIWREVTAS